MPDPAPSEKRPLHPALRHARRVIISVVGFTVLLIGVALIVLPGPAFVVIPAGLAVLAVEYEWSRRWLENIRSWVDKTRRGKHRDATR